MSLRSAPSALQLLPHETENLTQFEICKIRNRERDGRGEVRGYKVRELGEGTHKQRPVGTVRVWGEGSIHTETIGTVRVWGEGPKSHARRHTETYRDVGLRQRRKYERGNGEGDQWMSGPKRVMKARRWIPQRQQKSRVVTNIT